MTSLHERCRHRVQRLQEGMARERLDCVVVSNPRTFRYLTGHHPLLSVSPTRPWYVVVPAQGDPVACIPSIGEGDFRTESWIDTVLVWSSPQPQDEGRSALLSALRDQPCRFGRIGAEFGREMRATMPFGDLDAVRAALPDWGWFDASGLIWSLRMVKDADEVAAMRRAIAAAARGFAGIGAVLGPGLTERDAARRFTTLVMEGGADAVGYLACGSGPGGYPSLTRSATDRALKEGDIVGFDVGAVVDGYWCDFNRNYLVGVAPAESLHALDALDRAIQAGLRRCEVGRPIGEIRRAMQEAVHAAGFAPSAAGRWGHGVGLDFTEPPSVTLDDGAVLQSGMVITLEPALQLPSQGRWLIGEEMVLITGEGAELLTPAP